jgi:hypothetical protein
MRVRLADVIALGDKLWKVIFCDSNGKIDYPGKYKLELSSGRAWR